MKGYWKIARRWSDKLGEIQVACFKVKLQTEKVPENIRRSAKVGDNGQGFLPRASATLGRIDADQFSTGERVFCLRVGSLFYVSLTPRRRERRMPSIDFLLYR